MHISQEAAKRVAVKLDDMFRSVGLLTVVCRFRIKKVKIKKKKETHVSTINTLKTLLNASRRVSLASMFKLFSHMLNGVLIPENTDD